MPPSIGDQNPIGLPTIGESIFRLEVLRAVVDYDEVAEQVGFEVDGDLNREEFGSMLLEKKLVIGLTIVPKEQLHLPPDMLFRRPKSITQIY